MKRVLDKELRRFLIRELRCYNGYKRQMTACPGLVGGGYLRHIEQTVNAVDEALESLSPEQRKVVDLMFFTRGRYTADGVAMQVGYHRATVYRIAGAFLEDVGRRLGYVG